MASVKQSNHNIEVSDKEYAKRLQVGGAMHSSRSTHLTAASCSVPANELNARAFTSISCHLWRCLGTANLSNMGLHNQRNAPCAPQRKLHCMSFQPPCPTYLQEEVDLEAAFDAATARVQAEEASKQAMAQAMMDQATGKK